MSLRHPAPAVFLLVVFLLQQGCGHVPPPLPDCGSGRDRSVGVVSAKFLPEAVLDLPAKGGVDGAVRGAGRGFLAWAGFPLRVLAEGMSGCTGEGCGYLAVGILALAAAAGTAGAVVGGVQGAVKAIPAKEAVRIEAATRHLSDLQIQETMRDRILEAAAGVGGPRYVSLPDVAPGAPDCVVDLAGVAGRGLDSIVEVAILSIGFHGGQWGRDPPLSVFLNVRVRWYCGRDGRLMGEEEMRYLSDERKFIDWMADDAALMREEFRRGYGELASRIVDGPDPDSGGDPQED